MSLNEGNISGIVILASQNPHIDFKGKFESRVRKSRKTAIFDGGIYSADASPARALALGAT